MYGSKIVCGLDVELIRYHILVQKGLCLDCCGCEIYLPLQEKIEIPEKDGIYYLVLLYKEIGVNPAPTYVPPSRESETEYQQIEETYEIMWQTDNPYVNHEFIEGSWKACGEPHPLAIASIINRRGAVTLIEYNRLHDE